eukprot:jgi/Chlat1/7763/Chrsp66S07231
MAGYGGSPLRSGGSVGEGRKWKGPGGLLGEVAAAGKQLGKTLEAEEAAGGRDLLDVLTEMQRGEGYSFEKRVWPVQVTQARLVSSMPAAVLDAYASRRSIAFAGNFPDIRRAWCTVDNTLFLWRLDQRDDSPVEYSGEDQAICAVGLAPATPGVFIQAIQYLLVLATAAEIVLIGVCLSGLDDEGIPVDIQLQTLPMYSTPSDSIVMTCIQATQTGRIFLGGQDGHLYELFYGTGSGWRQRRCWKVCHTASMGRLLPSFMHFGKPDSLVQIAVDNDRNILYTRTQSSAIRVYDLGSKGDHAPQHVAEISSMYSALSVFRGGDWGRNTTPAAKTAAQKAAAAVEITTIPPRESRRLHLVAVTADGRRVFFSVTNEIKPGSRPASLAVRFVRNAPPQPERVLPRGMGGGAEPGPSYLTDNVILSGPPRSLQVESGCYSEGVYLIADSGSPDGDVRLLVTTRDLTLPMLPTRGVQSAAVLTSGLRELLSVLLLSGQALAIDEVPIPKSIRALIEPPTGPLQRPMYAHGELATQHVLPRRHFAAVCTSGITDVVKNRPVDILRQLLEEGAIGQQEGFRLLEEFFRSYGPTEAVAMCLILLTAGPGEVSSNVMELARAALEDRRLGGVPRIDQDGSQNGSNGVGTFDMGKPVTTPEMVFSDTHNGMYLYTARLMRNVWDYPVVSPVDTSGGTSVVCCTFSVHLMNFLELKLRALEHVVNSRKRKTAYSPSGVGGIGERQPWQHRIIALHKKRKVEDAAAKEEHSLDSLALLLQRSAEAILLMRILNDNDLRRLVLRLDSQTQQQLLQLSFKDLVATSEGDALANKLVGALMKYYTTDGRSALVDELSEKLRNGCPSYFNEDDRTLYRASCQLQQAKELYPSKEYYQYAQEALQLFLKVARLVDVNAVCKDFQAIRFYEGVVQLPLKLARELDPEDEALRVDVDESRRRRAIELRDNCYCIITDAIVALVKPREQDPTAAMSREEREQYLDMLLRLALQSQDSMFHERLYQASSALVKHKRVNVMTLRGLTQWPVVQTLIELGLVDKLLDLKEVPPYLEEYLKRARLTDDTGQGQVIGPEQATLLELLAKLYIKRKNCLAAALVYQRLAERRSNGGRLTLEERMNYYNDALLQAQAQSSQGRTSEAQDLVDVLEGKRTVLDFQIRQRSELLETARRLQQQYCVDVHLKMEPEDTDKAERLKQRIQVLKEKAEELATELKELSDLYNNYAQPYECWELCIEMIHFANYTDGDGSIIKELWDRFLTQGVEVGGIPEACARVQRLGGKLYPNESSFPFAFVAARLERLAYAAQYDDRRAVPSALLHACKRAYEPVVRVYESLLARRAELPEPGLRLRLLQSLLWALQQWAHELQTAPAGRSPYRPMARGFIGAYAGAREALGTLVDLCGRYAMEARRLQVAPGEAEAVAKGFEALKNELAPSAHTPSARGTPRSPSPMHGY